VFHVELQRAKTDSVDDGDLRSSKPATGGRFTWNVRVLSDRNYTACWPARTQLA